MEEKPQQPQQTVQPQQQVQPEQTKQPETTMPKKKNRSKTPYLIMALILVILVLFASYYLLLSKRNSTGNQQANTQTQSNPTNVPQKPIIENGVNIVNVTGEMPTENSVALQKVEITNPGFVLIRRDNQGAPGEIIGISEYLPAGVTNNVDVTLRDEVTDGEILYAMIYSDNTADGEFNVNGDEPAKDPNGNLALYSFYAGGKGPDDDAVMVGPDETTTIDESTPATESGM